MNTLKIKLMIIAVVAICSLQFAGCTRDDNTVSEIPTGVKLINDNYMDEYGNVGNLYMIGENPGQLLFDIVEMAPVTKELCNPSATGTMKVESARKVVKSVNCEKPAKNCWYDKDKTLCSCPGTYANLLKEIMK